MKKIICVAALMLAACASTPPAAPPPPPPPAPMPSRPAEEAAIGTARVTTASLNVRKAGSLDGEIVTQVKKGERVSILQNGDDWLRVRLGDGTVGWVSRSLVAIEGEKSTKKKTGCDTDFQFAKMPTPAFSDSSRHGLVVVEANVNTKGDVTSTRVITNTTGDEALGFLAEREMKSTKFVAPMRNCVPRAFIFTYKRSF